MKNRTLKFILLYLFIWIVCVGSFWLMGYVDADGYSIVVLWLILPLSAAVISFLVSKEIRSDSKWFLVLFFGLMHLLAEYTTFSLSNMLAFDKFNLPEPTALFMGAAASFVGVIVSVLINRKRGNKND